jgi:hypothetical protein
VGFYWVEKLSVENDETISLDPHFDLVEHFYGGTEYLISSLNDDARASTSQG